MASKQPWREKLYESGGRRSHRQSKSDRLNMIFTSLLVVFAVIITLIIGISIYLSTGGSLAGGPGEAFFDRNVDTVAPPSEPTPSSTEESSEASSTEESSASTGATITVQAGEGPFAIAQRGGITVERLYELNPEFLSTGSWYANPGDVVRID